MARIITKGTTNVSDYIYIQDSTDGSAETGITVTNLDMQYVRDNTAPTAKVDATAGSLTAHSDNTIVEVDATDQPGLYKVDWPDAAFATGVDHVVCTVSGTGFAPVHREFILTDLDLFSSIVEANVTQISDDATAASNLEAAYDGTGYAGGTIKQEVNMVAISSDTVAADNLESYCDGTTPMPVNTTQISGDGPAADNAELFFDGTGYAGGTTPLNVQVSGIDTDAITAAALSAAAVTEITDDIMAEVVESQGSYTVQQVLSIVLAVLAGETSSGGATISTPDGVSTRVAATVDGSNNRTAMTLTPSS